MIQSLPQSALHWAATLQTEDWTYQIYDTFLAPVSPPLGSHLKDWGLNSPDLWHIPCSSRPSIGRPPYRLSIKLTRSMTQSLLQSGLHWAATLQTEDWTHQIYDTVLAPVSPPLGGHLTDWGLNLPDLWHSPCPSQPSIGRPPYRLRIEPTRSMTQSLPQSALHWAATLQTEDWTHQIYDTVLAPVSPPLGGHLTDWGLNLPDLWHSPCPSQPSTGRPPYRRAWRPRGRRRSRGRWARWRRARRRCSRERNAPYAGPSWSRSAGERNNSYVFFYGVTLSHLGFFTKGMKSESPIRNLTFWLFLE